jgi:prepilin-type N-terminal cleavage/methylation domain-containing protein
MIQWKKKEEGYTLVELLMVLGILGILLIAIQTLLVGGVNLFHRGESESEARRQLYYAAEQMIKTVRNTPATKVTLRGTTNGVYDQLELVSSSGAVTRFYLQGDELYREDSVGKRMVSDEIAELRFSVNCDVTSGIYETYDASTRKMTDLQASFTDFDPGLRGMVARFESISGMTTRYIYRKITNYGSNWIELDSAFTAGFQPTNNNFAIGKTYQIYLKNRVIQRKQSGSEVTTGVTPRF